MPRYSWSDLFSLYSCALLEAHQRGLSRAVLEKFFLDRIEEDIIPVSLRWVTRPELGFPRKPFKVYRRSRHSLQEHTITLVENEIRINGVRYITWDFREMCAIEFHAIPDPNANLIVQALHSSQEIFGFPNSQGPSIKAIPGQTIVFSSEGFGRFVYPGITLLRVSGIGRVLNVRGVDQNSLANDPNWQLFEVVGLPFEENEVIPPSYNTERQGLAPGSLFGTDAALMRLEIAKILQIPPSDTGLGDIPTIEWPAPNSSIFLRSLRESSQADFPALVKLIRNCLVSSDNAIPSRRQMDYSEEITIPGIRQTGIPTEVPQQNGKAGVKVVNLIMSIVSIDSFGATGLGYGTTDLPPKANPIDPMGFREPPNTDDAAFAWAFREPPNTAHTAFDYMVTGEFVWPFGIVLELAALAKPLPLPESLDSFQVISGPIRRPQRRDLSFLESIKLEWNFPARLQGYGLFASLEVGAVTGLNARRIGGGYDPIFPNKNRYTQKAEFDAALMPLPVSGTHQSRYLGIGVDVFGRWSQWVAIGHLASAPDVTKPGLIRATITPDISRATAHVVPSKITIEFSWDWSDRSPDRIEFTGMFFLSNSEPPALSGDFFYLSSTSSAPKVVLKFAPGEDISVTPEILSGHAGRVEKVEPDNNNQQTEVRRYRLTIENLLCDFTSSSELAYAVFARGAELIRPNDISEPVGPRVARITDPIGPSTPEIPVDLRWTALPDAVGSARGILSWTQVPYAAGYIIWEATESALRHILDPTLADPPSGTSMLERARDLQNLMNASDESKNKSLQAFSRVNTEPIRTSSFEFELPGDANIIYLYKVSSVGSNNMESERSANAVMFAVPRQVRPSPPRLMLRRIAEPGSIPGGGSSSHQGSIQIIILPSPDPRTAGYRIYRTQKESSLDDLGLFGPPIIEYNDSRWQDYMSEPVRGSRPDIGRAVTDTVPESWYAYYYRAIAIGTENLSNGELAGESNPSNSNWIYVTPSDPPILEIIRVTVIPIPREDPNDPVRRISLLLGFSTNLPLRTTPLGTPRITIGSMSIDDERHMVLRTTIQSFTPLDVHLGKVPRARIVNIDSGQNIEYSIHFMKWSFTSGYVMANDPLGRTTEKVFEVNP